MCISFVYIHISTEYVFCFFVEVFLQNTCISFVCRNISTECMHFFVCLQIISTEYMHVFCLQKYFYGIFMLLMFVEIFLKIHAAFFFFFCSSISHVHQPIHKNTVHVQKYFSCPLVFTYPQKYCSCLEVFLQSFASICLQKYFSGLQKYSFYIQKEFSSFYNFFLS